MSTKPNVIPSSSFLNEAAKTNFRFGESEKREKNAGWRVMMETKGAVRRPKNQNKKKRVEIPF